jgi:hypothetical protein
MTGSASTSLASKTPDPPPAHTRAANDDFLDATLHRLHSFMAKNDDNHNAAAANHGDNNAASSYWEEAPHPKRLSRSRRGSFFDEVAGVWHFQTYDGAGCGSEHSSSGRVSGVDNEIRRVSRSRRATEHVDNEWAFNDDDDDGAAATTHGGDASGCGGATEAPRAVAASLVDNEIRRVSRSRRGETYDEGSGRWHYSKQHDDDDDADDDDDDVEERGVVRDASGNGGEPTENEGRTRASHTHTKASTMKAKYSASTKGVKRASTSDGGTADGDGNGDGDGDGDGDSDGDGDGDGGDNGDDTQYSRTVRHRTYKLTQADMRTWASPER